tara:strand:+ start:689 stop:901 length:213 start_codon:yes stop_codon:yes gene_type:complete
VEEDLVVVREVVMVVVDSVVVWEVDLVAVDLVMEVDSVEGMGVEKEVEGKEEVTEELVVKDFLEHLVVVD